MSITVECHISWGDNPAVHFTYADIPIVLHLKTMNSCVSPLLLQKVNFYVNDDHTIRNLYELSLPKIPPMVKSELAADLKMTTKNGFTLLKIIDDHGMIDDAALKQADLVELFSNYEKASSSGINEAFKIYEKSREIFPGMLKGGKTSRRRRRKAKRPKSVKRYNKRRY
jgi:hypothetical protein